MKNLILILFVLLGVSCKTQTNEKTKILTESKNAGMTPDFNVALTFINDYAEFCEPKSPPAIDSTWIERNPLLTENFKARYKAIFDSAEIANPESGLECDPIFYAQDNDSKYIILKADSINGYVTMCGKEWKESIVVMRVIYQNDKWLVEGSGMINIPKEQFIEK